MVTQPLDANMHNNDDCNIYYKPKCPVNYYILTNTPEW